MMYCLYSNNNDHFVVMCLLSRLFYFYLGYGITIPSGIMLQGYFDASKNASNNTDTSLEAILQAAFKYIIDFINLSWQSKGWGLITGIMVSSGFCFNFIASGMISPAAAFGVAACEPVANLLLSMFFADALLNCDNTHKYMLYSVVLLFVSAIILMAISAS